MHNLLTNAVKFQRKGVIKVVAALRHVNGDSEHAMLEVSVKDHGVGMTPKEAKNVFEAMRKAETR